MAPREVAVLCQIGAQRTRGVDGGTGVLGSAQMMIYEDRLRRLMACPLAKK